MLFEGLLVGSLGSAVLGGSMIKMSNNEKLNFSSDGESACFAFGIVFCIASVICAGVGIGNSQSSAIFGDRDAFIETVSTEEAFGVIRREVLSHNGLYTTEEITDIFGEVLINDLVQEAIYKKYPLEDE